MAIQNLPVQPPSDASLHLPLMYTVVFLLSDPDMDLTVHLKKDPGQSLGIGFKSLAKPPHCQVVKMVENGVASGLVHKGDLLLSINGLNVQHLNPAEISNVLERFNNKNYLDLEIRRSLANGNLKTSSTKCSDLVQNGHPVIYVEPTSPDRISLESDSPSPSPDMFSTGARPPRTNFLEPKGLPQIEEMTDPKSNGLHLLTADHPISPRHSLTPEATRKPLDVLRKTKMRSCKSLDLGVLHQWRTGSMPGMTVHNLLNDSEMTDRLYNKRTPVSRLIVFGLHELTYFESTVVCRNSLTISCDVKREMITRT